MLLASHVLPCHPKQRPARFSVSASRIAPSTFLLVPVLLICLLCLPACMACPTHPVLSRQPLQVTGGAPNKLSKIKVVRKSIARVLTVYQQTQRNAIRSKVIEVSSSPSRIRDEQFAVVSSDFFPAHAYLASGRLRLL